MKDENQEDLQETPKNSVPVEAQIEVSPEDCGPPSIHRLLDF